ncbi:DUF3432 domain-containing protein [Streptosporangium vulgare]|uniref:DUF3432 domain-containing protein n=1 Tax=Streptosporangium vulgare TaxID=46190 RepID=A0ABV5TPB5_9ACTN
MTSLIATAFPEPAVTAFSSPAVVSFPDPAVATFPDPAVATFPGSRQDRATVFLLGRGRTPRDIRLLTGEIQTLDRCRITPYLRFEKTYSLFSESFRFRSA